MDNETEYVRRLQEVDDRPQQYHYNQSYNLIASP